MKLYERILCIFFPSRCCVCDKVVLPGNDICEECKKLVITFPANKACCNICGLEYAKCACGKRLLYSHSTAPFLYDGDIKSSLHKMKFKSRIDFVKPFAKRMKTALEQRELLEGTDIITYIPMRKKSEFKRGYNQAELLAKELGKLTEIPVKPLLYKMFPTPAQHSLGMHRRRGNVIGIFEPTKDSLREIQGKRILIVDDIMTTGSTFNEAAKTLLIFGAERADVTAVAQSKAKKANPHKNNNK